jgi:hypothetical protein
MKKVFSLLISNLILANLFVNKALAQDVFGTNDLADAGIALGTRSIQDTIAGIVNIFLGFLGILATLILLYAGYLWMTSKGNTEKIEKAKLLIASAIIGLVIIVSAYAISRFILSRLYEATTPTVPVIECTDDSMCLPEDCCNGTTCGTCPVIPTTCTEPLDANDPRICSLSRVAGPPGTRLTIKGWHFDRDAVPGTDGIVELVDGGGVRTLVTVVECAGTSSWQDRRVRVKIPDTLSPGFYEVVLTNDIGLATDVSFPAEDFFFEINSDPVTLFVDCIDPNPIAVSDLLVPPANVVSVLGEGFGTVAGTATMLGGLDGTSVENLTIVDWDDLRVDVEIPITAISSDLTVYDDSGLESDFDYLDISCDATTEALCVSGCCYGLSCMPADACSTVVIPSGNQPVIDDISPNIGAGNTLITIFGYRFGEPDAGTVTFDGTPGILPSALSGGICIDHWTDDYIIMGVPPGADDFLEIVVTQALINGGESSDPFPGFNRDASIVRPGICSLGAIDGSFGDTLTISGVNFDFPADTDTAYFDTIASYSTDATSVNSITTEVPNVVGNLGVTIHTDDPTPIISNPLPFSALAISGGNPVITELSPDIGPMDSYMTILGSSFGNSEGLVFFDPDPAVGGDEIAGIFDFPAMCGDYWFDNYIIVRVPTGLIIGDSYFIRIERNGDSAESNNFNNFTVNNAVVGPQICAISPDNGPIGNSVNIYGENFGPELVPLADSGDVFFYDGVSATFAAWNDNQVIGVEIPVGANIGPVFVRDASLVDSNDLPFNVGACTDDIQCGGGSNVCCAGEYGDYCTTDVLCADIITSSSYIWEVSTEAEAFGLHYNYSCTSGLQSPTPWPHLRSGVGADGFDAPQDSWDAFVDSNIAALFTRDVEDADLLDPANIELYLCSTDACTGYDAGPLPGIITIINGGTSREGFVFNPDIDGNPDTLDGDLLPNRWYEVVLGTFEAEIGADTWTPTAADEWIFGTRDSDLLCEVSNINVSPQGSHASVYPGRNKNFSASPVANNCNICGGSYDWAWSLSHNPGPASDYASHLPPGNTGVTNGFTRLTGGLGATELLTPPSDVVTLEASIPASPAATPGQSYPVILAPVLRIENYVPNCDDSCGNALIWADFNTELQLSGLTHIDLYHCTDATCTAFDGLDLITSIDITDPYRIEVDGLSPLTEGETYMVTLDASIVNIYGYTLGTDFTWQFTVGTGNCVMNGAEISPDNYTAYSYNDINYRGYAMADGGSCGATAIDCPTCAWNWSTSPVASTIASIGTGSDYVTAVLSGLNNNPPTTDIDLTIDGGVLGVESDSTPLTVNVGGTGSSITELAVSNYFPNCGACTNSEAQVWFNSDIDPSVLINDNNFYIIDTATGAPEPSIGVSIIGNRHVIIDHGPFTMGLTYAIVVSDAVINTDGDWIVGGWQSPDILIENDGCLADAAYVDPANNIMGASDTDAYRAVTTYDAAACGEVPVVCTTCTYDWQDVPLIGNFDVNSDQETDFITLGTVVTGDTATMTLQAWEGATPLSITPGSLALNVASGPGLNLLSYDPDCIAGSDVCTNAQITARFDTPIQFASLAGNAYVMDDATDPVTNGFILTGRDRTVIIETTGLILGHNYTVTLGQNIANTSGNLLGVDTSYGFTVGAADCRIDSVDVDPSLMTAGASQGISYHADTSITTMPGCGDMPVYCDTCSYAWIDNPNDLGGFSGSDPANPLFTTDSTVLTGQSTQIEVDVVDQTVLFEDFGDLDIVIGPPVLGVVDLVGHYPAQFPPIPPFPWECLNMAPSFTFDTSNGVLDRASVRSQIKLFEDCATPGPWCEVSGSVHFSEAAGLTEAVFHPDSLLNTFKTHRFFFEDFDAVISEDGFAVTDLTGDLWNPTNPGGPNSLGLQFNTQEEMCSIYSTYISYEPETDNVYNCIGAGCADDDSGTPGNQHRYNARVFDIRGTELSSSPMTYTWASSNDPVVHPEAIVTPHVQDATAGNNGEASLSVEVYLDAEPTNVISDSLPLRVSTCQSPWPGVNPWDDGVTPDMNFSTWYCQNYDSSGPSLPYINIPNQSPAIPGILREYISTIYYGSADSGEEHPYLGSLAYYNEAPELESKSWTDKLSAIFKTSKVNSQAAPLCTSPAINFLGFNYDGLTNLELLFNQPVAIHPSDAPTHYQILRQQVGVDTSYVTIDHAYPVNSPVAGDYYFVDSTVAMGNTYNYIVVAHASTCSPSHFPADETSHPTIITNTSGDDAIVDIIGFRIMTNPDHLSIQDWYIENAPNPSASGAIIQVDGYEAMQVGSTIYVAASNIEGGTIYTNVYIIAHNIGASATTANIYSQFVNNFKLNINVTGNMDNTCHDQNTLSCSSDFDCPYYCDDGSGDNEADCTATWQPDYCDSQGLKLRRDTKRLTELISINNAILDYGNNHKACSNNSLISCEGDTDCPSGGTCEPYYPPLNSGSYLDGLSTSRWPSWQDTLASTLGIPLTTDPINLFNGCPDDYSSETCWNETTWDFYCPANSLIYMYNIVGVGQEYYLGANFEYDMHSPWLGISFSGNLYNPIPAINFDINTPLHCDDNSVDAPGFPFSPYCGNGLLDSDYCTVVCDGCDAGQCGMAGGSWIEDEECDGDLWTFACSQEPPNILYTPAFPIVGPGGASGWWNERTVGCHPPGALDSGGNLIECRWYRPDPAFTAEQCGGYCGDGTLQPYYETCDGALPVGEYTCVDGDPADLYCGGGCQVMCDDSAGIYPAALCGDGIWSEGTEQCDSTANPTGLAGWDCTDGGSIGCNSSCGRTCSIGVPYEGLCGDGEHTPPDEICDYANYTAPLPPDSGIATSYACTLTCEMNGEFCGDGVWQYEYQEMCEYNGGAYPTTTPLFSDEFHQYGCRDSGIYTALDGSTHEACTATVDGWCGDGSIQTYWAEECDPGAPWDGIPSDPPLPATIDTRIDNQYLCDVDCVGRNGGWCGDGVAQIVTTTPTLYEVCDGGDYPGRPMPVDSRIDNSYTCADNCIDSVHDGGYCGDGDPQAIYYEQCDWDTGSPTFNYPWPRGDVLSEFSAYNKQYECSTCINQGGYCSDGVIDTVCSVNCRDWDGGAFTSSEDCTEDQCTDEGGIFEAYEQCDNGYDPFSVVNKDVDIVYIFDMSGSMEPPATQLCNSTASVINTLNADYPEINYRISIFVLGDGNGSAGPSHQLTSITTDNATLWNSQPIFDALYSDCSLLTAPYDGTTIDPARIRYLSFYDNDTNDINGEVLFNGDPSYETCFSSDSTENWGYAIKRIAEDYNWLEGYHRIVAPVSDEYASCGGGISGSTPGIPAEEVEDFDDASPATDILMDAVAACNADAENPVFINPVLFPTMYPGYFPAEDLDWIGPAIAEATGGLNSNSILDWELATISVINSTICDGAGGGDASMLHGGPDGSMDCTLSCGLGGATCSSGASCCSGSCTAGTCAP